ncbi:Membrane metallo-endopeptidase-like 1 [Linnemannia gamsii]|uniref:Membrane metallo-endopeptidase-like 1 n=1 Tax=Linnemannia gamsii TaxID=64522 RepID=A0ABQ7JU71_9FUNG|nr:Membrane metallo-endopeptidase-like 1 [Linnemannia gamsii]
MIATKLQILMAIGVALSVAQAGPIQNSNGNKPSFNNKATCTSQQCVIAAAGIISDMDSTVDPCQDFSKFTCGGFHETHEFPAGKTSIGPFDLLRDSNANIA